MSATTTHDVDQPTPRRGGEAVAAWVAVRLGGVEPALPAGDRVALHVATPDSGSREALAFWQAAQTTGVALAAPGAFPWTLSNSVTGRISLALGVTGPCTTWVGGPEAATEAELAASPRPRRRHRRPRARRHLGAGPPMPRGRRPVGFASWCSAGTTPSERSPPRRTDLDADGERRHPGSGPFSGWRRPAGGAATAPPPGRPPPGRWTRAQRLSPGVRRAAGRRRARRRGGRARRSSR